MIRDKRRPLPGRPWTATRMIRGLSRRGPAAVVDCLVVAACYIVAFGVRTGARLDLVDPSGALIIAFGAGILQVFFNVLFEVYWRNWSVAALEDLIALTKSTTLVVIGVLAFTLAGEEHFIPVGAVLAGGALTLVVESAIKLRPRWPQILRATIGRSRASESIVIVGAGRMGQLLARDLTDRGSYRIACFVDDDERKWGSYVRGIRVAGRIDDLPQLIDHFEPSVVVIAVRAPGGPFVRRVVALCEGRDVSVRAVSGLSFQGNEEAPLRTISIEELLERDPVDLDTPEARAYLTDRCVLVTGAAGSIGSELARQVANFEPSRLVLLDTNESGLHDVVQRVGAERSTQLVLGDIRDRAWLDRVFAAIRPDVVFHAAAYKHVPILETSPLAGLATNVIGTANVLGCADAVAVERFVFISSDKAVSPANVLGLTKRFGELITIAYALARRRKYTVVRFGNVLGSAGSVVPTFTRQIDAGGPVTITHAEATRYFMTIREAAGLVIEAGAIAGPGDLHVLDMGEPVAIVDLARRMIRLRGLRTPRDIVIEYTGLRPGEKLHEDLVTPDEVVSGTQHPRVTRVVAGEQVLPLPSLLEAGRGIEAAVAANDPEHGLRILRSALGVAPSGSRVPA